MKKFRNVPAIITLLAGFVTSVVMIVNKYSLKPFLWILVLVMAGFYISGIIIRLNKAFSDDKEKDKESQDTESSQDDSPSEDSNEKADNQSEKNEQK